MDNGINDRCICEKFYGNIWQEKNNQTDAGEGS